MADQVNVSSDPPPNWREAYLINVITLPLSTAIILANLVIILGIACNRQLHNTTNYFFLSLLVADLCTGVALPFVPWMGLSRSLSFTSCLLVHIFPNFLFLAFLFNLVMVHYERYMCIVSPLHYSGMWVHRLFPLALFAVWAPPLLFASLPALGWNNRAASDRHINNTGQECCSYKHVFPNAFIYLEVYGLLVPAILSIAGMTGRVLWITRGQMKDICRLHRSVATRGDQASYQEQQLNLRYSRCVVAVSLTFLACWVPYIIYTHVGVAFLLSEEPQGNSTTHIVLSCTGIGSMTVVPLVLGLANRQYTDPLRKVLHKLRDRWRWRNDSGDIAL
ncbi:G-protein coupled bile acid receptor 1 [Esox lucius]|uniref:G-protein coupled bile acid receptor 1 n=1 Tax=Esox lucius TaxID=8010 RepID=A0AAY5KI86_ESOLU|nr:G-protein coupled bile acid receptor 1 [Esox lucius]XP_034145506.1 G-protein coupled bile acid receptor 1 [Esox lucius]XP_034145507.1 G-protein coupled bile acid receptor 1 [Esox lucius]